MRILTNMHRRGAPRLHLGAAVTNAVAAIAILGAIGTAQAQTSTPPAGGAQTQPSPQGPPGPLDTGSGGAPPESPQGETPPNMQTDPQKPDKSPGPGK